MFGIDTYNKYKEAIRKSKPIYAIAFTFEETPLWMTAGYCFRCGQLLKWQRSKEGRHL